MLNIKDLERMIELRDRWPAPGWAFLCGCYRRQPYMGGDTAAGIMHAHCCFVFCQAANETCDTDISWVACQSCRTSTD